MALAPDSVLVGTRKGVLCSTAGDEDYGEAIMTKTTGRQHEIAGRVVPASPRTDPAPTAHQDSLLALLAFSPRGAEVVERLRPEYFDTVRYQTIAERLLDYWAKYKKPPGRAHLDDLFAEDLKRAKQPNSPLEKAVVGLMVMGNEPLNEDYIINNVGFFLRKQNLKRALLTAAERYEHGGEELVEDVEGILRDALVDAPLPASGKAITVTNAATVEVKRIEWLWQDRIPRGQHITMTGLPFVGKSLLMAWFAAQISAGRRNPDGTPGTPGRVFLLSHEDVLASVLKPRLQTLDADMSRIDVIGMVRTDKNKERSFLLAEDLKELERLIRERPDTVMVGIDPITAYLGSGKIDSHKAADVRAVLEPLNTLAENTGVLVFSVTHPAKSSQSAINSFVGSQAFIAVPRMGYLVAKELDNDKHETERVLFSCVGTNIGERPSTLAYTIKKVWVEQDVDARTKRYLAAEPDAPMLRRRYLRWLAMNEIDKEGDIRTARIVRDEVRGLDISADEILASGRKRGDAIAEAVMFLKIFLKDGARDSDTVSEAAEGVGISEATLRRAKKSFCHSYRVGELGKDGHWVCELKESKEK